MEFKSLGGADASALQVSVVGLGCNNFGRRCDEAESRAVIHKALDVGITFFDTADAYGDGKSETYIGNALGPRRSEVGLATKFGLSGGASKRRVMTAAEASLKRLRTDRIDLYQVHKPDPRTPIDETLEALDRLVRDGKVRYIGCSNFSGDQLQAALAVSRDRALAPFVAAQNAYSLLDRTIEADLVPTCTAHRIGILPYYPLASGLLSGKFRRGEPPPPGTRLGGRGTRAVEEILGADFEASERLGAFAAGRGRSLLALAMSWLACQPVIASVIAGARTPAQVAQNAEAAQWMLTDEERAEVDRLTRSG